MLYISTFRFERFPLKEQNMAHYDRENVFQNIGKILIKGNLYKTKK